MAPATNSRSATVAITGPSLLDPLAAIAQRSGFGVKRLGDAMTIDAPLGDVRFDPTENGTELTLTARTPAELQLLTDLYAQRLKDLSLGVPITWAQHTGGMPLNQIVGTVISIRALSPSFARLRLAGDFKAFKQPNAGLHLRLLLHPDSPEWPTLDANGLTQWPCGIASWHRPPYTVRRICAQGTWIDVDIVLHAGGRVTEWCDRVAPGDEVALHGPSGSKQPNAKWLGLIGDETALPVILRIIENAATDTKGQAFIATRHPSDAQQIETQTDIELSWLDMNDDQALLDALNQLIVPDTDRHIFFAAERNFAAQARNWLTQNKLVGPGSKAAAYWTR
ncbi:MAG: siderophore-interacting protein [Tateyamaria sp.]|jgi:NADPH-dependent ferric siderophore reductase|uniref:siderophore-interacting protein n=1 Tax=Tateyamaria sp. TaxID=1929288 RepID=UPI0032DC758B